MNTKTLVNMLATSTILISPLVAHSEDSFTGRIVGYDCTHQQRDCAVDRRDPRLALERNFILVVNDSEYYLLPNLSRDTKIRHLLQKVTVKGTLNKKYHSINVHELIAENRKGKKSTAWSMAMDHNLKLDP